MGESRHNTNRTLLNEEFNIKLGTLKGVIPVVYIVGSDGDTTWNIKDELKRRYPNIEFFRLLKAWGWKWNKSEAKKYEIYTSEIKPCLEYLMSVEKSQDDGTVRDVVRQIEELQKQLSVAEVEVSEDKDVMSTDELINSLEEFKNDLVNAVTSDELREKLNEIADWYRKMASSPHSSNNIWLTFQQDRKASDVRTESQWKLANREVIPGARWIGLFVPIGKKRFSTKPQREAAKNDFLRRLGKRENELTLGEEDKLHSYLNQTITTGGKKGFKILYNFVDVRFTRQIAGEQEKYKLRPQLEWYDENAEENEYMSALIDAALAVAKEDFQLDVVSKDDLGGARGQAVSTGEIRILSNAKRNSDTLRSIVHELSHTLLHQKYVQSKVPGLKDFYQGELSRELKEQQADICAYIVLRMLGIRETEKFNAGYVVGWGTNEENAKEVFDTVSSTANMIGKAITKKYFNEEDEKNRI